MLSHNVNILVLVVCLLVPLMVYRYLGSIRLLLSFLMSVGHSDCSQNPLAFPEVVGGYLHHCWSPLGSTGFHTWQGSQSSTMKSSRYWWCTLKVQFVTQVVKNVTVNGEMNHAGLSAPQPLLHCKSFAQSKVHSCAAKARSQLKVHSCIPEGISSSKRNVQCH